MTDPAVTAIALLLLKQLEHIDAQAAEIERLQTDISNSSSAAAYRDAMRHADQAHQRAHQYINERDRAQARVAELEGLLRPMTNGLRQFAANGIMDKAHEAWRIQAEHFCQLADATLAKREGGR